MNRIIEILFFVVLASACNERDRSGARDSNSPAISGDAYSNSGQEFDMNSDNIMEIEGRARRGDNESLRRLINYYLFSYSARNVDRKDKIIYWLIFSVRKGTREDIPNLLYFLREGDLSCEEVVQLSRQVQKDYKNKSDENSSDFVQRCLRQIR